MSDATGNPNFPENTEYWAAAQRGELLIKRCQDCARPHYYPRVHCPFCASAKTVWEPSDGSGEIYSYTIVTAGGETRCPAYVTIDNGPTMMTRIENCVPEELHVGMKVRVAFRDNGEGSCIAVFVPHREST